MRIALLSLLSLISADAMTGEMTGFFSPEAGSTIVLSSVKLASR